MWVERYLICIYAYTWTHRWMYICVDDQWFLGQWVLFFCLYLNFQSELQNYVLLLYYQKEGRVFCLPVSQRKLDAVSGLITTRQPETGFWQVMCWGQCPPSPTGGKGALPLQMGLCRGVSSQGARTAHSLPAWSNEDARCRVEVPVPVSGCLPSFQFARLPFPPLSS